jgi:hypothetical protein
VTAGRTSPFIARDSSAFGPGTVDAIQLLSEETHAMKAIGTLASLALVLAFPIAPAVAAPACPEVDSARAMLVKAAAAKNEQDLKQMPRNVPAQPGPQAQPGSPAQPGGQTPPGAQTQPPGAQPKGGPQSQPKAGAQTAPDQPDQARGGQDKAAPVVETAPVPEEMKRAAILVKEADEACQAGQAAQAAEKAQAAMALMKR